MKRLLFLLITLAAAAFSANKNVTVCWTPDGGTATCQQVTAGSVALVTVDLRQGAQYVILQPLPDVAMAAIQKNVDGQTYKIQQPDGSVVHTARYGNVQDLLLQYLIRKVAIPCLKLYPQPGVDPNQLNYETISKTIPAAIVSSVK